MPDSLPSATPGLVDTHGRRHTSMRLSVTDRCNIRCFYCMPDVAIQFQPRSELLTFEEIHRLVRAVVPLGVHKFRLTGGEPLIRQDLDKLVAMLVQTPGVREVAMTTNGILLKQHAAALRAAGLTRLNISLDTLDPKRFEEIARRPGLEQVLEGIAAAQAAGFPRTRINAIAVKGMSDEEIVQLVRFAQAQQLHLRFIEFMPLDAEQQWNNQRVLMGADLRAIITRHFGTLTPLPRDDQAQPAVDYVLDGPAPVKLGFISSVSAPFCGSCDRLRLTADGQLRNCLFSTTEWDARALLRKGASPSELQALVAACVKAKKHGHGIDDPDFLRPQRAMYQIGG
ncbi:MAG: GTP 3',8-cyclase MoaA [Planctomycetota bacterium]